MADDLRRGGRAGQRAPLRVPPLREPEQEARRVQVARAGGVEHLLGVDGRHLEDPLRGHDQGALVGPGDRRDPADLTGLGQTLNWGFAWPVNRRIIYNRASADMDGNPWDPTRKLIWWDGGKWTGYDVPDIAPTAKPGDVMPFIMNQEGVSRLFTRGLLRDGPFPAHYEPFESPVKNVFNPKIRGNPVARVFKNDVSQFGESEEFPFAATSYRLTEHFHYWTKHNRVNAALQPEFFVEISEELAAMRGVKQGGWVRVWSKRGSVKAKALVTKRIRPLMCDGKAVHVVGIPLHWGFMGSAKKGWGPNSLTPFVGDANVDTPEFKAFLVNLEPTTPPGVAS